MARCQGARESGLERIGLDIVALPHLARPDMLFGSCGPDCMACCFVCTSLALPSVELGVGHIYISPIAHRSLAGSGAAIWSHVQTWSLRPTHLCGPGCMTAGQWATVPAGAP